MALVWPWVEIAVINFEITRQPVTLDAAGMARFTVDLATEDSPVKFAHEILLPNTQSKAVAELTIPVVVNSGGRTVFSDVLVTGTQTAGALDDGRTSMTVFRDGFDITQSGAHEVVIGPVDAVGTDIEGLTVALYGLAFDAPVISAAWGYGAAALGAVLFLLGGRRKRTPSPQTSPSPTSRPRTSDIGRAVPLDAKKEAEKPQRKWGR